MTYAETMHYIIKSANVHGLHSLNIDKRDYTVAEADEIASSLQKTFDDLTKRLKTGRSSLDTGNT